MLSRSEKEINEFTKAEGNIVYLEETYGKFPLRNIGKYRYLSIEGTERVFQLFVGGEPNDFKPVMGSVDELHVGDFISLYYDDHSYTENDVVNRLTQYIVKQEVFYFVKDSSFDKLFGYGMIGCGAVIFITITILKRKGIVY